MENSKIYRVKFAKNFSDFSTLYETLKYIGDYCIYPNNILLLSKQNIKDIKGIIKEIFNSQSIIKIEQILDYENEIEDKNIIVWINQKLFQERSEIAQAEMQERIDAMYNIVVNAKKILDKGVEPNGEEEK